MQDLIRIDSRNELTKLLHVPMGSGHLGIKVSLLDNENLVFVANKPRNLQVGCPKLIILAPTQRPERTSNMLEWHSNQLHLVGPIQSKEASTPSLHIAAER